MTEAGGAAAPAPPPAWPPTGAPTVFEPGLPSPAYVLSRVRVSSVVAFVFLPVLFIAVYARLFRDGLPISRLINPGVIGIAVVTTVTLGAILGPRVGRPSLVAGADWVAARTMFARRWRMVQLGQADRYSTRVVHSRSRSYTVLTITAPAGHRVAVTFPRGDHALDEVLTGLRATGAQEDESRRRQNWRQVAALSTVMVVLLALPIVYFEIGPLRLLPRPLAGEFTWSGCRATLAAEQDHPPTTAGFLVNPVVAGGDDWRLNYEQQLDAATFAQRTGHPTERLPQLQKDGFIRVDQAFLVDQQGYLVVSEWLRFQTPAGALAYDRYVNRAVCEHEYGGHGPRPTEVRLFNGSGAIARWVAGSSIEEVTQAPSRRPASKAMVFDVAAALPG